MEPSLEQARDYINQIDFSGIIQKMVCEQGWLQSDAKTVCQMYRNFLYLNKKYGKAEQLPPSQDIDEFWHNHILDTKNYRRDCENIFGQYFDHNPFISATDTHSTQSLQTAFQNMLKLYAQEFNGEELHQVRGVISKTLAVLKKIFHINTKPDAMAEQN